MQEQPLIFKHRPAIAKITGAIHTVWRHTAALVDIVTGGPLCNQSVKQCNAYTCGQMRQVAMHSYCAVLYMAMQFHIEQKGCSDEALKQLHTYIAKLLQLVKDNVVYIRHHAAMTMMGGKAVAQAQGP